MSVTVKSSLSDHRRKGLLVATFLLLIILVASLIIYTSTINVKSSLEGAIHVNSEKKLRAALENTPTNTPVTIALDKDITLTNGAINIATDMDITLTSNRGSGFYKLIGTKEWSVIPHSHIYLNYPTIAVNGVLRLDGVIVTHIKGIPGEGVHIGSNGTFMMYEGEISGNNEPVAGLIDSSYNAGGVLNYGVFEMFGGKITNNNAHDGGGVYNIGKFSMWGGVISDNHAGCGGGVYSPGEFSMSGGVISNNHAGRGGGVHIGSGDFSMYGGTISDNHASEMDDNVSGPFEWFGGEIEGNTKNNNSLFYAGAVVIIVGVATLLFLPFKPHKSSFKKIDKPFIHTI